MLVFLLRHRYSLSLTAAAASWGVATAISKRAVDEIPPLILLPVQLGVSVVLLLVLVRLAGHRVARSPGMRRLAALGVLNPGIAYFLSLLGLTYITASLSVLLWATEPLIILILAWAVLGDRITATLATVSLCAVAGVALVVFDAQGHGEATGVMLTLAGVAACGVYTILSRRLMAEESTLDIVAVQQVGALLFSLVLLVAVAMTVHIPLPPVSTGAWLSAVVSGTLYYAGAFWLYLTGLRRVAAAVAGLFINLVPVFGVAAGRVLLSETLTPRQWIGAAVIIVSVAVAIVRQPQATAIASAEQTSKSANERRTSTGREGPARSTGGR